MTTFAPSQGTLWQQTELEELTCSPQVFPASLTALQASGAAATTNATSGEKWRGWRLRLGPAGWWLRMSPACSAAQTPLMAEVLADSSDEYCETWPRSGTMRNGILTPLAPLALTTSGTGFSSWPTPNSAKAGSDTTLLCSGDGRSKPNKLGWAVMDRMWPTPIKSEGTGAGHGPGKTGGANLRTVVQAWPTPTVQMGKHASPSQWEMENRPNHIHVLAATRAQLWPTPAAQDGGNSTLPPSHAGRDTLPGEVIRRAGQEEPGSNPTSSPQGLLSVEFVCWLMGFPRGWLSLNASEMQLYVSRRQSLAAQSRKRKRTTPSSE